MRIFFHIGRVNGTIEEERILWREGQLVQKRRKIFLHRGGRRKIREGEETLPRVSSITGG